METMATASGTARAARGERAGAAVLWLFWAVTVVAVAGFAVFGANPEMLVRFPEAVPTYALMYRWMPVLQVVVAFIALAVLLIAGARARWVGAFVGVYAVSLASELIGTTWGLPFGEYGYTAGLGPMWLDRVPLVIPLSWFYMAVPSYALVRALERRGSDARVERGGASTVLLGAALLTAWDLSLDPAMSAATTFWWWGESGPYYGMPLLNVAGWYVTGLALMAVLRWTRADAWLERVPTSWMASFYGANLFLAMGMAAAAGLWWSLVVTTAAILGVAVAGRAIGMRPAVRPAAGEARA